MENHVFKGPAVVVLLRDVVYVRVWISLYYTLSLYSISLYVLYNEFWGERILGRG